MGHEREGSLNVFNAIKRRAMPYLALSSHPHVRTSSIANYGTIHPTARINRSVLYGSVEVGRHAVLDDCRVTASARVSVGAYTVLSGPIRIVADLRSVSIGKFCSLAPDVTIWESLHNMGRASTFFMLQQIFGDHSFPDSISKGPIRVGNDVWIGTKAIVLSGVEIGDGAVIGAGAVVTKNVPPYCVAAGVPAAVVKQRFPEAITQRLLEIRWWDWDENTIKRNRIFFENELTVELLGQVVC
jgi:virginiamycin A acetyltransferase